MSKKIGFWAVFALVTGSQIGSGVLMLPANLAPYGMYGLYGWILSGCGAIVLALVFAALCTRFPQTGGPHVYIRYSFGRTAAFFTGWTYWIVSAVSTAAVVITAVGYLKPFIMSESPQVYLIVELALTVVIGAVNIRGIKIASSTEILLTAFKLIPLLILPLAALYFFDARNIVMDKDIARLDLSRILGQTTLCTLWGFIGLESATTSAGSVNNPDKTIPKAIILGTTSVIILYFINSTAIMGLIDGHELRYSSAPYVDAVQHMLGGRWHLLISAIASIVCIGTLNAWILTSSQILLGLAEDKLMPGIFAKTNDSGAPVYSVITSCAVMLPLLVVTIQPSLVEQIMTIIDFSATAFLFIYGVCSTALLVILLRERDKSLLQLLISIVGLGFCVWVISKASFSAIIIVALLVASGTPIHLLMLLRARKVAAIIT